MSGDNDTTPEVVAFRQLATAGVEFEQAQQELGKYFQQYGIYFARRSTSPQWLWIQREKNMEPRETFAAMLIDIFEYIKGEGA